MKFSVVIPVYNVENYIGDAIESVLSQKHTCFELILVNDGSKDNSGLICDKYASLDERVKVVHKDNAGVSAARNDAIKIATGDYLCFLDGDDFWRDELVLCRINDIITKNDSDIVQLGYGFYNNHTKEYVKKIKDPYDQKLPTYEERLLNLITTGNFNASAWGTVIRKQFVDKNSIYFLEGVKSTEDVEWLIRAFSYKPSFCVLTEDVYVYRKNREGAVTSNIGYENMCDYRDTVQRSVAILADKSVEIKKPLMNYLSYQVVVAIGLLYSKSTSRLTKKQKKELRLCMKKFFKALAVEHSECNKVKKALKIYSLFGFGVMARVLGFYLNHRGR